MTHFATTLSALDGMIASFGMRSTQAAPAEHPHGDALTALRSAQVQLYCDHDAAAITALRLARRTLAGDMPSEAVALASMDEAVWHIMRHEASAAQQALARAQQRLL